MEFVFIELFADKLELVQLLDLEPSKVQKEEQNNTVVDKGKSPSLYNNDEVPLSTTMANDDYINAGSSKISKFDVSQLKGNFFTNGDILNAYISTLAFNVIKVSK